LIFELFGYPILDKSPEAEQNRAEARCPFMDSPCDGGGNRYMSHVDLGKKAEMKAFFRGVERVPSGICSIQLTNNEPPWIVCPRRVFVLGRKSGWGLSQRDVQSRIIKYSGFEPGSMIGVWSEVKVSYKTTGQSNKHFDYTFDYILIPVGRISNSELEIRLKRPKAIIKKDLEKAGYSLSFRDSSYFVEDFPVGKPVIVEIMTSSTSGGDKNKRTTIPMAFEDAILGRTHRAPGINYRQVWARMVSQLVVKSEVGISWGGITFWVLQDVLVDYISKTTGLNILEFISEKTDEVNVQSLSYGNQHKSAKGIIELNEGNLYSGPICASSEPTKRPSFEDMIRAPTCPPIDVLLNLLSKRGPDCLLKIP